MTMKKVININFQGRVVPIEETAYELLKQYIESLRRYFANEEGRDEIINDIESRIAELFSERLKKGSTCITDDDVNAVIASMGRPEELEAESETLGNGGNSSKTGSQQQQQSQQSYTYSHTGSGRGPLYRNADDKIVGGVCSGLANYFNMDPVLMRIIFVLLLFLGPGFLLYLILWIVVPAKSLRTNITKRLYRSSDSRVIAGVCGGMAAYFNIDVWIPRLIFALPLIVGIVSGPFGMWWHDWDFWWGPKIISNSVGGTLLLTYVILWIALPVATTAAEKLEMRGEKVDFNSIRNTVKEDLESFKSKAQNIGQEVKESAQQFGEKAREFGEQAGARARSFAAEAAPAARNVGGGIGHAIGVIFKAFFLLIGGVIGIALLVVLASFFGIGVALMPFKGYLLDNSLQYLLAWATLFLFFGVPVLAFLVWLIRKIAGSAKNPYLAYSFGFLWIVGLFCFIFLIASVNRNFSGGARVQTPFELTRPVQDRLVIKVAEPSVKFYGGWLNLGDDVRITEDSLVLPNVRLEVAKSDDSDYHVTYTRYSYGHGDAEAEEMARDIHYSITQWDSTLYLDRGFSIRRGEKFRNQHVVVTVRVPIGKKILVDHSVARELNRWFSIGMRGRGYWDWDDAGQWINGDWDKDVEYIMTPGGIQRVNDLDQAELKRGRFRLKLRSDDLNIDAQGEFDNDSNQNNNNNQYRYKGNDSSQQKQHSKGVSVDISTGQSDLPASGSVRESIVEKTKSGVTEWTAPLSVFAGLIH